MRKMLLGVAAVGLMGTSAFAGTADFVFVVDESGSMAGEHAWLGTMVSSLDTALAAAGFTGRYGLVGYGAANSGGHAVAGHQHLVGGGQFGTAAQFTTATAGLVVTGGTEDGWDGIDEAMGYTFGAGNRINIVLVTDEDRDNAFAHTYNSILASLTGKSALLNAVINGTFTGGAGGGARIGVDSFGNIYQADGVGGFTSSAGGAWGSGAGTTKTDYVDLAWATAGAAWNLNILRSGGLDATSFTNAFVDIKVQEVVREVVPLPSAVWAGLGLLGVLGAFRMRRRTAIELS